jgi:hypothetical protein
MAPEGTDGLEGSSFDLCQRLKHDIALTAIVK